MKTDNEIIAEFMKCSKPPNTDFDYFWQGEFFKSHNAKWNTSWDWLMPVVEKIKKGSYGKEAYGSVHFWLSSTGFKSEWQCSILGSLTYKVPINDIQHSYSTIDIPHITVRGKSDQEPNIHVAYKAVVEFIKWYNQQTK